MKRRIAATSAASEEDQDLLPLPLHVPLNIKQQQQQQQPENGNIQSFQRVSVLILLLSVVAIGVYVLITKEAFQTHNHMEPIATWIHQNVSEWPLLHIVNTRFMQEQGHFIALSNARLELFKIFCLPTMAQQLSQHFLWIIKTDPNLDAGILNQLQRLLAPYPNFFLVQSNTNFRINKQFPGAWRGGAETRLLQSSNIVSGDRTLLDAAIQLAEQKLILETRLDSDDGLHLLFVQSVQQRAMHVFSQQDGDRRTWHYWCARRYLQWHWDENHPHGVVTGARHANYCVTPGITAGFPVGTPEADVPIQPHHKLAAWIRDAPANEACGAKTSADCLEFVDDLIFGAARSRTPTSAGMLNVEAPSVIEKGFLKYAYWDVMHDAFGLDRYKMKSINKYLSEHIVEIARDNLMGQCTTGHSCKVCTGYNLIFGRRDSFARQITHVPLSRRDKNSAKEALKELIASRAIKNSTIQ
jgi:hypothetical protein